MTSGTTRSDKLHLRRLHRRRPTLQRRRHKNEHDEHHSLLQAS